MFGCTCRCPCALLCALSAHEALGCNGTRHSLRPLLVEGEKTMHHLGQIMPRECGGVAHPIFVMAGLVPAIHVLLHCINKDVDARDIGERKRRRSSNG